MDGEKNLHTALYKSGRRFSASPPQVFLLVIKSTLPRTGGAFGVWNFENMRQAAVCLRLSQIRGKICKMKKLP